VGHGQYRPLVPNDTPENRARNRRVEIRIRGESGDLKQLLQDAKVGTE
jgi:hypothetical protein